MTIYSSNDKQEGHLDRIERGQVLGWAWYSDFVNDPISVDLYVDDVYVSSVAASSYRPDLEKAGKGNGRHAFELRLPDQCYDGKPHSIRLCYHGTEADLFGSPRTVHFEQKTGLAHIEKAPNEHIQSSERGLEWSHEASKDTPKVSIIIPCYNLGAYLDQTVQSVLNQTFQDFEIIIIDDGSTDPATCHLFASYQRPKTRILRTENQGLAKARNLGIAEARGIYISCLDADDLFEPAFLQRTVQMLDDNPSLAFASCWLKGFGESTLDWNPTACEFPLILAEDRVCMPALMRRDALQQVGGFDAQMPVPGYEDWDLLIGLEERGQCGSIVPEYLVRYRSRNGSMKVSGAQPENHAALMRYMVEKHAASYRKYLPAVLSEIEKSTCELNGATASRSATETDRIRFLEDTLRLVLSSRSWQSMRPVRRGVSRARSLLSIRPLFEEAPKLSVILTCCDQGRELPIALHSVRRQLGPSDEVLVVDDGSTDLVTLQILDWYRESGLRVIQAGGAGFVKARADGLKHASGEILFALGAEQAVESGYFQTAIRLLDSQRDAGFVTCGVYDEHSGFSWIPETANLQGLIACPRVPFPMVRRASLEESGGYETNFHCVAQADWDLVLRLESLGHKGKMLLEALVIDRVVDDHRKESIPPRVPTIQPVMEKHKALFDIYWKEAVLGFENQKRRLMAKFQGEVLSEDTAPAVAVNWGDFRRLQPMSAVWGLDRGQPIDRYYIEHFLDSRRDDIRGRVLEVKDSGYSRAFGSTIDTMEVVDITPENPSATSVCDLSSRGALPRNRYDCFIITQTIHIIYETRNVIKNAYDALKPGGVLLATLPCVSRIDYESGLQHDQWRFTLASARRLFEETFGCGQVDIQCYGNVLACLSFLMGLATQDLTPEELNHSDPYFPLLITVRAVKAQEPRMPHIPRSEASERGEKAVVIMYHRIDRPLRDPWGLCVSPENFAAHMACLRRHFKPVRLAEIAAMISTGQVRAESVAVTFDDGYLDNLTTAIPILRKSRIPATFFISGDGATEGTSFWWEFLAECMAIMNLDTVAASALHQTLMEADTVERKRILADLPRPGHVLPRRLTHDELRLLANDCLADIGAHGWSHRLLAPLSTENQRGEIVKNLEQLNDIGQVGIGHFAYPFGGPVNGGTRNVLREAGITAACTVEAAAVTASSDLLAIPRLEVGDWPVKEFEDRLRSLLKW